MPFDEALAARTRAEFARKRGVTEKTLFGCVGWLVNGNVCVCVWGERLVARHGDEADAALRDPNARAFDITGKPMQGWVTVGPDGVATDEQLRDWVRQCGAFVRTVPPKE